MKQDFLLEQLKTIKNLCEAAILARERGRNELIFTLMEQIFKESQDMNDEYCVVKDNS